MVGNLGTVAEDVKLFVKGELLNESEHFAWDLGYGEFKTSITGITERNTEGRTLQSPCTITTRKKGVNRKETEAAAGKLVLVSSGAGRLPLLSSLSKK